MTQHRLLSRLRASTVRFGSGISGYRVLPRVRAKRPAVILLHERYGIDRHTRDLTARLAQAGYVGFAPDLFSRFTGDKKALQRGEARMELRDDEVLRDLGEAVAYLEKLEVVDSSRIAIIGVCQTGRHSVLFAAHRDDINGCAVLYGAVGGKEWGTDELRPEPITALIERLPCPVLGIFGEADHIISVDDVLKFRACLEQYKKSYRIKLYPDAPHGWLNDTMPGRYRKEAAKDAWQLLLSFLKRTFGSGWDRERILSTFESDLSRQYDFKKNVRLE
ncbi:MAG: dienelactone hydrolase family protein [Candidatus Binatia bacterium]